MQWNTQANQVQENAECSLSKGLTMVWSEVTPLNSWEPLRLVTDSFVVSATSPLGRMPSANQTRFCSRGQPENKRQSKFVGRGRGGEKNERWLCGGCVGYLKVNIPSWFGCLRTDTGTMTVGGGELRVPAARACCRGGMVLQYSDGTLGFGLGPTGLIMRSRAWAATRHRSWMWFQLPNKTHSTSLHLRLIWSSLCIFTISINLFGFVQICNTFVCRRFCSSGERRNWLFLLCSHMSLIFKNNCWKYCNDICYTEFLFLSWWLMALFWSGTILSQSTGKLNIFPSNVRHTKLRQNIFSCQTPSWHRHSENATSHNASL